MSFFKAFSPVAPRTKNLINDDNTFFESVGAGPKAETPVVLVRYQDVHDAFKMMEAALQAKTGATERLCEDNARLQSQVEALQKQLSQACLAELDCGTLREEIERLMQVKAEICQQKAEVIRANHLLIQERNLACEQLEGFESETQPCASCEERAGLTDKCQELEKKLEEAQEENVRLRQQLQHFREFYKKSKQNWQSEQGLLLQVIQLQSRTCDHLLQPSRASSATSSPKPTPASSCSPQPPTPSTPVMGLRQPEQGTPYFTPAVSTPRPTPRLFSPGQMDASEPEALPPLRPVPKRPPNCEPSNAHTASTSSPDASTSRDQAPSTASSSSHSSTTVRDTSTSNPPSSRHSIPNSWNGHPDSYLGACMPLRHVNTSRTSAPISPSQASSQQHQQDLLEVQSPGSGETSPAPMSSPPSLGNRLLLRSVSEVGWKMPPIVSTFGIGAAVESSAVKARREARNNASRQVGSMSTKSAPATGSPIDASTPSSTSPRDAGTSDGHEVGMGTSSSTTSPPASCSGDDHQPILGDVKSKRDFFTRHASAPPSSMHRGGLGVQEVAAAIQQAAAAQEADSVKRSWRKQKAPSFAATAAAAGAAATAAVTATASLP